MATSADKRSFAYCDETCPDVSRECSKFVDAEFDQFIERVKSVSAYRLRSALTEACQDLIAAESEVEDLKRQVDSLTSQLADAKWEIKELEKETAT